MRPTATSIPTDFALACVVASTLALALLVGAAPASAQTSGGRDSLNDTNERLSNQSQIRGIQNQQQFENNQTRMQIQRNELFRPGPTGPGIVPQRR